jgi:hypothetical protein
VVSHVRGNSRRLRRLVAAFEPETQSVLAFRTNSTECQAKRITKKAEEKNRGHAMDMRSRSYFDLRIRNNSLGFATIGRAATNEVTLE